jgi:hypothetical protein
VDLQAGLDELRHSILRDASALKSGPDDQFWSDESLIRYIEDAQRRFARLSLCLRDDTTVALTQVTLVGDGLTDTYTLHPSVLKVVSARHQDDTKDMANITHYNVNTQNSFTETFEFASYPPQGKPTQFTTDEGMDSTQNNAIRMRFFGMPLDLAGATQTGKTVFMRVIRTPMNPLSIATLDSVFEIPEDYHLDMLEWAAYRALRNLDIDGEDRTKAAAHKTRFEEAVAECKREMKSRMWQPLMWGFGSNGFTYLKN